MTLRLAGLGLAFCLLASSAWADPDPVIRQSVAVCDPNAPKNCVAPLNGAIPSAAPVSSANGSSTVTTALTFQTLLATNAKRDGCSFQNTSADIEYVFVGATGSATVAASAKILPGGSFDCAHGGIVISDNLAVTSATLNGATYFLTSQ